MQNIHTHAWDTALHFQPSTIAEADVARGFKLDLTVKFDEFMRDMAPFDRVVVFGMKARLTGYWVPDEYIHNFVRRAPEKLVGFACCDPTQPNCLEKLRHACERLGMAGVKMGPIYAGFDPRDPRCDPVYTYCQERELPILFHAGTTFNRVAPLAYGRSWIFDEVAVRYPRLKMVLAHVGHPFQDECVAVIRKHPNLFADLSALYYRPWQFYNILMLIQEYKVGHKILFGTDYPFAKGQDSIDGLRNVNRLVAGTALPRIADELIESILARDSLALLGIK